MILFTAYGAFAAGTNTLSVTATVLSKNICMFSTASSTLNFGSLDPATPVDVTVSTTFDFRCMGSNPIASYVISDDDGLYETAPNANRMRHTTVFTEYLPYNLTLSPTSGTIPKGVWTSLTVTGTVFGVDYQNAYVGSYADTVVISIVP